MITIDARLFSVFQNSSEVTLVNKLCHKKSVISNTAEKIATASAHQIFEFDYLCHTVFDHKIAEWVWVLQEDNFRKYNYQTPGIFSTPREKFYPPPKV
ncbi:hypothetical protein [Salinimicrobium soli]|uniref:hypothetical protein n=1 Tax=Salinimicrobium soli TaxID=1254399 RepID=UPI003AB0B017